MKGGTDNNLPVCWVKEKICKYTRCQKKKKIKNRTRQSVTKGLSILKPEIKAEA